MADLHELIGPLIKKTESGEVRWQPSGGDDAYTASFGSTLFSIDRHYQVYTLDVVEGSKVIDSIKLDDTYTLFGDIEQLWTAARRNAYGTPGRLDEILKDLT